MIKSKKLLAAGLAASLVLAACGGDDDESTTTDAPAEEPDAPAEESDDMSEESHDSADMSEGEMAEGDASDTSVGLLFDLTGRGDKSFNDAAAAGLDRAADELGITPSESAPSGDDDRAPRLELFVDSEQDLIIGVGFLWDPAVSSGAAANPDTNFAIIDSVITTFNNNTPDDESDDVELNNVASLVFAANQGSYLVGVAAALESESGKIGFIGGVDFPLINEFEAGFLAGARATNPDIEILSNYVSQPPDFGGFTDIAKAKEIASQMYADGADVVYHAAGLAGNGLFEAASEAGDPGDVWAIGVDSDQYQSAATEVQPYILTSMLKRVDVAVFETIKAQAEGTFAAGITNFDLSLDGVGYSTTGDFLAPETIEAMEAAKADIIAGTIEVPLDPSEA